MSKHLYSIAGGFLLTLLQILFVCAAQNDFSVRGYRALAQWDSFHYRRLVENGYFNRLPPLIGETDPGVASFQRNTNVAFFPGYMLAGRAVRAVTGWTSTMSLLAAAALAAIGFWSVLITLMRRWSFSRGAQVAVIIAIMCHPAAFFLVAAYSESLFLFGLLGFIFWSERATVLSGALAAAHGIVMTATRIFGLPLIVYPLVTALARPGSLRSRVRRTLAALPVALGAGLGGVLFFAYSSVVLGKWKLYMLVQEKGWGIVPDYLFLLHPPKEFYAPTLLPLTGNHAGEVATIVTFALIIAGIALECLMVRRPDSLRVPRIGLWTLAFLGFYMSAASLAAVSFRSMLRYSFIPWVLAMIALGSILRHVHWRGLPRIAAYVLGIAIVVTLLAAQIFFIRAFTAGLWVA